MVTTAFGTAELVEEVKVSQRANGKAWTTHVQLLEDERGEWFVRFAYSTGGTARRGPVTLRGADLERLRKALEKKPRLRAALGSRRERSRLADPSRTLGPPRGRLGGSRGRVR